MHLNLKIGVKKNLLIKNLIFYNNYFLLNYFFKFIILFNLKKIKFFLFLNYI